MAKGIIKLDRCFTRVGSGLTRKHNTSLKGFARDIHSSLLGTFVNYKTKKFYKIWPRWTAVDTLNSAI